MLHVNDWDKVCVEESDYAYKLYATPSCQEVQRFLDLLYSQTCQPSCTEETSARETFCSSRTLRTWEIFQEAFRNASPEKEIQ